MAISVLAGKLSVSLNWNAQQNLTGTDYQPILNATTIAPSQTFGTANADGTLGGADEIVSYLFNVTPSNSVTVNTQNLTNILQTSGVALARITGYMFRLLSETNDTVNGTNCTHAAIVSNANVAQNLNFGANSNIALYSGGFLPYMDQTGTGFLCSNTVSILKFLNVDNTNTACIQLSLVGSVS